MTSPIQQFSPPPSGGSAIPMTWAPVLASALLAPSFAELQAFLEQERAAQVVFPPADEEFTALKLTPFEKVRVVILGQDPYPTAGHAHGLAFSVPYGQKIPRSLSNIFRELADDLGIEPPDHGNLSPWAEQGVLLLNTVLTVREGEAGSHARKGWEQLTDAILAALAERIEPLVFLFWGGQARKRLKTLGLANTPGDNSDVAAPTQHLRAVPHVVIETAHPSPLSARRGFFGSKPFSRVNQALAELGQSPIDWRLPPERQDAAQSDL